jgi:hypothetical protein
MEANTDSTPKLGRVDAGGEHRIVFQTQLVRFEHDSNQSLVDLKNNFFSPLVAHEEAVRSQ